MKSIKLFLIVAVVYSISLLLSVLLMLQMTRQGNFINAKSVMIMLVAPALLSGIIYFLITNDDGV